MDAPQFKEGNVQIFNEATPLYEMRKVGLRCLVAVYLSVLLVFAGIILIFLNNLSVLVPGIYFGALSWVTIVVFSIGLVINFVSIPYLYFSSYRNFVSENDFWDKETFWILPLFFFGTFFLYCSEISPALGMLLVSLIIIASVHFKFFIASKKILNSSNRENVLMREQYFLSLKYLTAYYLILLFVLVSYNPLQHLFIWIRIHA
jgi:hypothetical protein